MTKETEVFNEIHSQRKEIYHQRREKPSTDAIFKLRTVNMIVTVSELRGKIYVVEGVRTRELVLRWNYFV